MSSKYLDIGLGMLQKRKAGVMQLLTDAKAVGLSVVLLEIPRSWKQCLPRSQQQSNTMPGEWTNGEMIVTFDLNHFDKYLPTSFGHVIELWIHADILLMFLNRVVRNLSNRTHIPFSTKFVTIIDQKLLKFIEEYARLDGANSPLATQVNTLTSLFNLAPHHHTLLNYRQ
jgi:hypothetical protein